MSRDTTAGTSRLCGVKVSLPLASTLKSLWVVPTWPQGGVFGAPPTPPPRQAHPELRRQVICPILLIRPPCVTCSSILMSQGLVPLAWPCKDPHTNLCKMGLEGVAGHSRRRGARVGEWRLYSMTQNPRGLEQRDGGHGRAAARTPPSTEEDSLTPLGELKHSVR